MAAGGSGALPLKCELVVLGGGCALPCRLHAAFKLMVLHTLQGRMDCVTRTGPFPITVPMQPFVHASSKEVGSMCDSVQVGTHTFTVTSSTGAVVAVNNPMAVQVFPAATAADASGFTVDMASPAAGATAVLTVYVRDRLGAPLTSAAGVQVTILGK